MTSGPIFRSISKWGAVAADGLHPDSVNAIVAGAAQLLATVIVASPALVYWLA